jgi:hypothetical protein
MRGDQSILYDRWVGGGTGLRAGPLQGFATKWLSSFKESPPGQKTASFNMDKVVEQLSSPQRGAAFHVAVLCCRPLKTITSTKRVQAINIDQGLLSARRDFLSRI